MKKLIFAALLTCIAVSAQSQTMAGEYKCHFTLNQAGNLIYKESGEKSFTIVINEKGDVAIKMDIEIRDQKTQTTNYVDMTGSAEGTFTPGDGTFEANGNIVISIYEKEKLDTRWDVTSVFRGTVTNDNGALKCKGGVTMTRNDETTSGNFTGTASTLDIPFTISYKLGYDYAVEEKVAFPLSIRIDYTDENYIVKKADLLKIYVPGTDMNYDYTKKSSGGDSYSYQTQDPDNRAGIFGPDYNISLVDDDNTLGIEFNDVNENFLQMLPPNAPLCYITKVEVMSRKDNKYQEITDTFRVKIKNHFKVHPLTDGKFEKAMAGSTLLEAGSGARFFPLGTSFKIPIGARVMVQFIDGSIAIMEYPLDKSYPDLNVTVSLGISSAQGVNGEGDVIQCKLEGLTEKGVQKGTSQVAKATLKMLLSTAQKANAITQLFDFFAPAKIGGEQPVVMVRLRSVVGISLGTDGSFVLKNYEGHPEVVAEGNTNAIPAGKEFNAATGKLQNIVADADFDGMKSDLSGTGSSGSKSFIDKLTGEYLYYSIAGAGLLLVLVLFLLSRNKKN
ncbi:MAG: hypothetical protein IPP73_11715 [Chitinophagaceae bacterium]|nr:hypothetical protein [Chitinophagaceae bacterium]